MMIQTHTVACEGCGSDRFDVVTRTVDHSFRTCDNVFTFVRCLDCSLLYLRDRPDPEALDRIYPDDYVAYDARTTGLLAWIRATSQRAKYRRLRRHVGVDAPILDYGCGSGEFLRSIRARHRGRLLGSDVSPAVAPVLAGHGIDFVEADLAALAASGPLGAVVMNQVIEHLPEPHRVLRAVADALAPGGVLYLETPSPAGWDHSVLGVRYWGGWHAPRHFFVFDDATLSALLRDEGFRVVHRGYFLSPFLWNETIRAYASDRRWLRPVSGFFTIRNVASLPLVAVLDLVQLATRRRTSNLRIIAVREPPRG